MKTEFDFKIKKGNGEKAVAKIVNYARRNRSFVFIDTYGLFNKTLSSIELSGNSLETFAVNILKAMKSNKLK